MNIRRILGTAVCVAALATPALAWHVDGYVYCDSNRDGAIDGLDLPLAGVVVRVENLGGTFHNQGSTNSSGYYEVDLADDPDTFIVSLDPASLPSDANVVVPAGGSETVTTTPTIPFVHVNFLVQSSTCKPSGCWLTGGGTKWDNVTRSYMAERDPKLTFGGNVHPGCSPTAGEGGNWNHLDRVLKLHFQGTAIPDVECGNVDGIPPGSESPKTPVNFIEYRGTGRVQGIAGNKADYDLVYFFARAEDHNEPGSNGAKDGSEIDTYFLHVWWNPADPVGSTLILVDGDGDPTTVDPVRISTGNLQIHVSSCDNPPL